MTVLTIRLIRSFEYRNVKLMVLKNVDLSMTTQQLLERVMSEIQTNSAYLPHRTRHYDTLKKYHTPHSFKSNHLVINFEDDEHLILKNDQTLSEQGVIDEHEISCFIMEEYEKYKQNPENKW